MFFDDQIVSTAEKSNEFQLSLEIPIIPTSVSPFILHDDHGGAREDNNDSLIEVVDQVLIEPHTPLVKP